MKALLTCALFFGSSLLQAEDATTPRKKLPANLPQEILNYYRDVNFIACFSNNLERKLIHDVLRNSKPNFRSERLQKIAAMLDAVKQRFDDIDPAFVKGYEPSLLETASLTEVGAISTDDGMICLQITRHSISEANNDSLIASFGKEDGGDVLGKAMDKISKKKGSHELHFWRHVNGRWIRSSSSIVLLKSAK